MSTHRTSTGSTGSPGRPLDHCLSWTDDLPVCHLSGVGFSTNQIYREDGNRREEHEFEDKSFHFSLESNVFLYGVLDGHEGSNVSNFAAQRLPAELLLGQLEGKAEDAQIIRILQQAFIAVEKGYMDSIDEALLEKANVTLHVPEGMSESDAFAHYPELSKRLDQANSEIVGGTQAVVALIYDNKLYVANVGCSRALLVTVDGDGVLRVRQLTVDHDLSNEDELNRLANCNLNIEEVVKLKRLGTRQYTRTIGDYYVKNTYKNMEVLCTATSDPVIAEPEVLSGINLEDSCGFLLLMSDGLYRSLEDASMTKTVNAEIASMVAGEFSVQSTLNGVAQAVVDKVVRIHHDTFMTCSDHRKQACQTRDDITLLVRNFNYPLNGAVSNPPPASKTPTLHPGAASTMSPLSVHISPGDESQGCTGAFMFPSHSNALFTNSGTMRTNSSNMTNTYTSSNDSTQSTDEGMRPFQGKSKSSSTLELDAEGRVQPYVDFSDFYKAVAELTETQREALNADVEPRPAYETIPEETSTPTTTDQVTLTTDPKEE